MVALQPYVVSLYVAALIGALIAVFTFVSVRIRTLSVWFFIGLNASAALWAFAYAVPLALLSGREILMADAFTRDWFMLVLMLIGVSGTISFWFLFCAAHAHRYELVRGWPMWLCVLFSVYTIAAGATNAWTHMFASRSAANNPIELGTLEVPHLLLANILGLWGLAILCTDLWSRKAVEQRVAAVLVTVTVAMTSLSSAIWCIRTPSGQGTSLYMTPIAIPIVASVLVWASLRAGVGGIGALLHTQRHRTSNEPAITLDERGIVLAMNDAAEAVIPRRAIGRRLDEYMPAVASEVAHACARSDGYRIFQHFHLNRVYWGRATCSALGSTASGCMITFTDITDNPDTQAELRHRLGIETVPQAPNRRIADEVRDLIGDAR